MIRRRQFISLLGGAAAAWPVAARAQQSAMPVVGYLSGGSPDERASQLAAFHQGLREGGFVEGQNVHLEYRWAEGRQDRLSAMAADLVSRGVNVVYATAGIASAVAAKSATRTIPIVFSSGADPVQLGLVASLNRPGGNITGISNMSPKLEAKRLGLLHELVPQSKVTDVFINPAYPGAQFVKNEIETAAGLLKRQIRIVYVRNEGEIASVFMVEGQRPDALFVTTDPLFVTRRHLLVALAARYSIPASYFFRDFPLAGGLMSYGPDTKDGIHKAALYVGRILNGEKPADLPIQLATKFEFVINLKTAKALGLTVPPMLLARADEVIE